MTPTWEPRENRQARDTRRDPELVTLCAVIDLLGLHLDLLDEVAPTARAASNALPTRGPRKIFVETLEHLSQLAKRMGRLEAKTLSREEARAFRLDCARVANGLALLARQAQRLDESPREGNPSPRLRHLDEADLEEYEVRWVP